MYVAGWASFIQFRSHSVRIILQQKKCSYEVSIIFPNISIDYAKNFFERHDRMVSLGRFRLFSFYTRYEGS